MKSFTTSQFNSAKQLLAWQEIMSEVYYSLEIRRTAGEGLRGLIREYDVGPVSITTFDSDEQRVLRTRDRIAVDPDDSFVFVMPRRKHLYYSQNGRSGVVAPGGYVLVSTSEFYELSCPDGFVNWTVKMPGPQLRARIPNVEDYCACRFPNNRAMAHIARSFVRSVAVSFGSSDVPNPTALGNSLVDLMALVVRSEEHDDGLSQRRSRLQLRRRILEYIRDHLQDADLSPHSIATKLGISTSYLYRLFEDKGNTVGQLIIAQRLQWAYELLASDGERRFTVAEVAYAAGFRNVSHFSRVFTERYHMSPSAVRTLSMTDAAPRSVPPN